MKDRGVQITVAYADAIGTATVIHKIALDNSVIPSSASRTLFILPIDSIIESS